MSAVEFLDRLPTGWFVLDVMKVERGRKWDWGALIIDVHPDEHKHCWCKGRAVHEAWLRIPGKHRNRDAAWDAFEDMIATRH